MFGIYQHSELRIELAASSDNIGSSLTEPLQLQKWLWPHRVSFEKPSESRFPSGKLSVGQAFDSGFGPAKVGHCVEQLSSHSIRFLLSGSIDGFHEWQWGDGWVQSRLEGVSLLPLNLGQTLSIVRLRQHLQQFQ